MVHKTTIEQLQTMLEIAAHEGRAQELRFNQQGWEYYLVDNVLRGISFVEDNRRKALWLTWPLKVEDLILYADFFSKKPYSLNMYVMPTTGFIRDCEISTSIGPKTEIQSDHNPE